MAGQGMVDDEARPLFARLGPLTNAAAARFDEYPDEETWQAEFRPQCLPQVTARRAAEVAAAAWRVR